MTTQNTNPFILSGVGQACADLSGNPLLASMEMMRKAWSGLAGPGGLMQALPITPPTNLEELDRRIAELRSVESWLRMNLSMLGSTIQAMEVQRATITTLRSFADGLSSMDATAQSGGASPLEVALGLKPAPKNAAGVKNRSTVGANPTPPQTQRQSQAGDTATTPEAGMQLAQEFNAAAQSASQAWWELLQQQFNQIAAATRPADATPPPSARTASEGTSKSADVPPKPRPSAAAKPRKTRSKGGSESNKS
jgi:hypothetical protein